MNNQALLDHLRPRQAEMLAAVTELVDHESPSTDKVALDGLARRLLARFTALGAAVTLVPNPTGGDHLQVRIDAPAAPTARPALILCHFDTVWATGTLAARPVRVADGRAYGPGIFDMKASFVLVEYALRALQALALPLPRPVVALFTSDEEIGSPTSRAPIEQAARESAYALVLESPLAGGRLKTARKGGGRFTITVEGRAAHAGVEPEKGINAIVELAHQILRVSGLSDPATGATINVGVVQGGTVSNVVPAEATARVDVRVTTLAEAERIARAMAALHPVLPGARVSASGGLNRPPMERTPAIVALFEQAKAIGQSLELELTEGATGGGSDGNFTAALGLPTLDGLGTLGSGAHAEDEHILIATLPERAALLAALLRELTP